MPRLGKAIVTNRAALRSKYGAGFDLEAALKPLLDADRKRGLETRVFDLSDAKVMGDLGGGVVKKPGDPRQNKAAVDAVATSLRPLYLMILGSVDVVPHQDLQNPTPDDEDPGAPGDLPYACEAPYSRKPSAFRAPTRVVGRLPDLTGASEPDALHLAIATAANWKLRSRDKYESALGITAQVWKGSTALSLRNTFGSSADMQASPSKGPRWAKKLLDRRMHFINCHGAPADPQFYGQKGDDYPVAHDADFLKGRLREGTVATAECCYGAELYDPADVGGVAGIASTYLTEGAYGFFGSSTIAYGPAEGNGAADLICQFFLQRVLAGASLGRAALEARQRFVRDLSVLDPVDLKTLVQFSLMGDPSIHPIPRAGAPTVPVSAPTGAQDARRANLMALGLGLEGSRSYAEPRRSPRRASEAAIEGLRERFGLPGAAVTSHDVAQPPVLGALAGAPAGPTAVHVLTERLPGDAPARRYRTVVGTERDGEIIAARELLSR